MGPENRPNDQRSARHDVLVRLRRAEGQVRGLQRQIVVDAPCTDVLVQVQATTRALQKVGLLLLESHLRSCAARGVDDARLDNELAEVLAALARLVRS